MATKQLTMDCSYKVSWWVKPFIKVCWLSKIIGFHVDDMKAAEFIANHGITIYIDGNKV